MLHLSREMNGTAYPHCTHKKHKGWYKVGIVSNLNARLNSYQTSDPKREFILEFSIKKEKFRECEKHIHEKFINQSEWVKAFQIGKLPIYFLP